MEALIGVKNVIKESYFTIMIKLLVNSEPQSILEPPIPEEEVREMQEKFFEEQRRLVQLENERRKQAGLPILTL